MATAALLCGLAKALPAHWEVPSGAIGLGFDLFCKELHEFCNELLLCLTWFTGNPALNELEQMENKSFIHAQYYAMRQPAVSITVLMPV